MEIAQGTTKIEVKLSNSGRYTWSIQSVFRTEDGQEAIQTINKFNKLLKAEFPDFASRGSGRVASMDED